jgi:iron-sulfur cluster assembly accessory protein
MSESDEDGGLLDVTPDAARKVNEIVRERGLDDPGVAVGVEYDGDEVVYTLEFADEPGEDDVVEEVRGVTLYVDEPSRTALEGARVDFVVERGREGFKVIPPERAEELDFDDSLEGRVREFLATNFPQIQGHGGEAVIEELDEDAGYVELSLEGACSGCGISDATANAIRNNLPTNVDDITDVDISTGRDDDHVSIDPPV